MTSRKLRVAVIGPRGQAGSCVVDELLTRGHAIVGVSRNPPKQWKYDTGDGSYSSTSVEIYTEQKKLINIFSSNFDAIVCAFGPSFTNLATVYEGGVEAYGRIKTASLASTHEGPFIIVGMWFKAAVGSRMLWVKYLAEFEVTRWSGIYPYGESSSTYGSEGLGV
ncbi:hypothetical protein CSAL01_05139 [Colletotrichum salicis]|uniref:NAD(P)-binding domain-containing protein n=1 Tax=Colletotrichum salicis TaxID=1209931 RepID=A0A135V8B5_9PEZI|nr:hypothetical protein CSAL01_05139 [Colletotrichum salicis]